MKFIPGLPRCINKGKEIKYFSNRKCECFNALFKYAVERLYLSHSICMLLQLKFALQNSKISFTCILYLCHTTEFGGFTLKSVLVRNHAQSFTESMHACSQVLQILAGRLHFLRTTGIYIHHVRFIFAASLAIYNMISMAQALEKVDSKAAQY